MLWVKAFHIVFVASWFAGLFYLPRIFVNLAMVTSWGRRVMRKSRMKSATMPPMVTHHRVGEARDVVAAAGGWAAREARDARGTGDTFGRPEVSFTGYAGPARERHWTLVLTGSGLGSTPLVARMLEDVPAALQHLRKAGMPLMCAPVVALTLGCARVRRPIGAPAGQRC